MLEASLGEGRECPLSQEHLAVPSCKKDHPAELVDD